MLVCARIKCDDDQHKQGSGHTCVDACNKPGVSQVCAKGRDPGAEKVSQRCKGIHKAWLNANLVQ